MEITSPTTNVLSVTSIKTSILIQRRRKSDNKLNNERTERKLNVSSFSDNVQMNKTNVNKEYEIIEDYMNTSSNMPTKCRENDISLIQNQAYASVKHS